VEGPHALALAFSAAALGVAVISLARGAPARLRDETDSARRLAQEAIERVGRCEVTWEAAKAEYGAVLEAVNSERETIQRHRARLSAQESRERNAEPPAPQSREEILAELRQQAGILNAT
jgi:hypothetical protein